MMKTGIWIGFWLGIVSGGLIFLLGGPRWHPKLKIHNIRQDAKRHVQTFREKIYTITVNDAIKEGIREGKSAVHERHRRKET